MNVTLSLSDLLKNATGQREPVQVSSGTPLECLQEMADQFPILNKWVYDESSNLKAHVWILVNNERIYEDEFAKALKDGDHLFIMVAILGG